MRQLELLMGKDNFQKGIRIYLKKYSYGNATWNDLISILSKYSKTDLYAWNKVWVNQPGRPVFNYNVSYTRNHISHFTLTQTAESGPKRFWPQAFDITLIYSSYRKDFHIKMTRDRAEIAELKGAEKPMFILFNSNGLGYGLFPTDKNSVDRLFDLSSPLQRASSYITAYENMLDGRYFKPEELLNIFISGLHTEKDEMNLRLLTGYVAGIYWQYLPASVRMAKAPELENILKGFIILESYLLSIVIL